MAFFDARSCSVQYVVFDPSTGRCAPVDPVLDYDEKSVPTAAPSADALLAFACESETSRLNEFAILITCGSLQGGHRISAIRNIVLKPEHPRRANLGLSCEFSVVRPIWRPTP
jgi:hypothetical protein